MLKYPKIPNIWKFDNKGNVLTDQFSNKMIAYLWKYNLPLVVKEKLDGTHIRVIWDGYKLSIAGRTEKSQIPQGILDYFNTKIKSAEPYIEQMFKEKPVVFFGEGLGPKIQSNRYNLSSHKIVFFDLAINGIFVNSIIFEEIMSSIGFEFIDPIGYVSLSRIVEDKLGIKKSPTFDVDYVEGVVCYFETDKRIYYGGNPVMVKVTKKTI